MLDIYKTVYQLKDHPFRLAPDHRFSQEHPSYANAKAYLQYAISQGEGFIAITGEPGTGKTTLIHGLLAELDKTHIQVASLIYAQLDPQSLIEMVATSFNVHSNEGSKASVLAELKAILIKQSRHGLHAVLIVDEAQGMSPDSLEELRLLSNLQHDNRLLMQVFLVGQEHLLDMIHAPGMEHLQQRLIAASHLQPLDLEETVTYVEHRLCHAGWLGDPAITEDALRLIHKFSGGVPRRINLICHRLFLYGGLEHRHELVDEDARHVIEELHNERVLATGLSAGDLSEEEFEVESGDAGAPALGLPRKGRFVSDEQPGQQSRPAPLETHMAERSDRQTRSAAPEPESAGNEPLHLRREREQPVRVKNESLQAAPEEPDIRPGPGMRLRLIMVLALLAGLIFVAVIETGISHRLTGGGSPAPVEIGSPDQPHAADAGSSPDLP